MSQCVCVPFVCVSKVLMLSVFKLFVRFTKCACVCVHVVCLRFGARVRVLSAEEQHTMFQSCSAVFLLSRDMSHCCCTMTVIVIVEHAFMNDLASRC